jgi:hypothetical protein
MADLWYFSHRIDHGYRRPYFPLVWSQLGDTSEVPADADITETFRISVGVGFVRHVDRMMIGRKAFRTSHGMIGICPETVREGDCVAILLGANVPMVLRPLEGGRVGDGDRDGNTKEWRLIGESYVHGMMDGEALRWLESRRVPFQGFRIR